MAWCWLALVDRWPEDADAAAAAADASGRPAGVLAAWRRSAKPVRHALRADARFVEAGGEGATVSLVLAPPGVRLPFDDLAVQQARRRVLAGPPVAAVSTLLRDASHFAGAVTAYRATPGDAVPGRPTVAQAAMDDPFARVFGATILEVGPGLVGAPAPPAGPTIERYGSAEPWPWDVYRVTDQ
jgi:hypothetical protein